MPALSDAAMMFAESDGIQLYSVPQPSPGQGFSAAIIQARATNPDYSIVTLGNIRIGSAHQVWSDVDGTKMSTSKFPVTGPLLPTDWIELDSHLVISPDMVGGNGGAGYDGIDEANDGSTTGILPSDLSSVEAATPFAGYGDIQMADSTDGFFLTRESRGNSIDLAYVVAENGRIEDIPVTLTAGVLGSAGSPDSEFFAMFGFDSPITVPIAVPEPASGLGFLYVVAFAFGRFRRRSA